MRKSGVLLRKVQPRLERYAKPEKQNAPHRWMRGVLFHAKLACRDYSAAPCFSRAFSASRSALSFSVMSSPVA